MSHTNALKGWCVTANHKVCNLCGATYGWGESCDCVREAEREKEENQIEQQVNAFLRLQQCGKGRKKNDKRA